MTTARAGRHVVLVGPMGSGKTTIGRPLAAALKRPLLDNDDVLSQRTGRSARDIAQTEGLGALHAQEAAALGAALDDDEPSVIGAAASTIVDAGLRDRLRDELVVWLNPAGDRASPGNEDGHRPDVGDQSEQRDPLYEQVADLIIDTDACTPEQAVARIMDMVTLAD